jgi:hypothetical protein
MKRFLLILLLPISIYAADPRPIDLPESKREVTFAIEGEDATSASYYFFYTLPGDDRLAKVRTLWNGGYENKPTIKDYYLDGSSIFIVERSAERRDLPVLIKGRDAAFETLKEHTIKLGDDPASPESTAASKEERAMLSDLVSILSMSRKQVRKRSR